MWFFRSPNIAFGEEALLQLAELKGRRAFIVTDANVAKARLVDPVLIQLEHGGFEALVYDAVPAEPDVDAMSAGAEAMAGFDPDWIIAVGGGSVMDAAKGMWVLHENPEADLTGISPLEAITLRQRTRLCCVPTTAGTGSEVTYAFVVSLTGEDGKPRKLGVGHPEMTPDVALVDPAMTRDLPRQVTADSGMDAVTQAIEGYVATWANEFSDGLCLTAIKQLFEFLPRAWEKGAEDMEAREKVANAATLAGLGYINSMVGAAHSMAHAAGAALGLPHGRACGLFLPFVIEYSAARKRPDDVKTRYAEIMAHLGHGQMDEHEAGVRLAAAVRGLARGMNQPLTLFEASVSREDFDAALPDMIENALADTVIFTAPRQPDEGDLRSMFAAAYG